MWRVCGVVGRLIERAFCAGLSVRRVIASAGFRAGQNRRGDANIERRIGLRCGALSN